VGGRVRTPAILRESGSLPFNMAPEVARGVPERGRGQLGGAARAVRRPELGSLGFQQLGGGGGQVATEAFAMVRPTGIRNLSLWSIPPAVFTRGC